MTDPTLPPKPEKEPGLFGQINMLGARTCADCPIQACSPRVIDAVLEHATLDPGFLARLVANGLMSVRRGGDINAAIVTLNDFVALDSRPESARYIVVNPGTYPTQPTQDGANSGRGDTINPDTDFGRAVLSCFTAQPCVAAPRIKAPSP